MKPIYKSIWYIKATRWYIHEEYTGTKTETSTSETARVAASSFEEAFKIFKALFPDSTDIVLKEAKELEGSVVVLETADADR